MPIKPVSNTAEVAKAAKAAKATEVAGSAGDNFDIKTNGFAASPAADFSQINKQCAPLSLRLQTDADKEWVAALHEKCFGPGRFARSAFLVREMVEPDFELCLMAQIEGQRVGSVWMTPIALNEPCALNKPHTLQRSWGYLLGPLAVDPLRRNLGIGGLLVKTVTAMALEKLPDGFVLLVGDAPYYGPFGYRRVKNDGIVFPGPVDPQRVLVCHNSPDHAMELSGNVVGR